MGEEGFDEHEFDAADGRTLVVRGGYCRDEVLVGICRSKSEQPDELVEIDGRELRQALQSMQIGEPTNRDTVRAWARARKPLDGTDAMTLEHAVTITERERDKARAELDALRTVIGYVADEVLGLQPADADREDLVHAMARAYHAQRIELAQARAVLGELGNVDALPRLLGIDRSTPPTLTDEQRAKIRAEMDEAMRKARRAVWESWGKPPGDSDE